MWRCEVCNERNPDTYKFCGSCSARRNDQAVKQSKKGGAWKPLLVIIIVLIIAHAAFYFVQPYFSFWGNPAETSTTPVTEPSPTTQVTQEVSQNESEIKTPLSIDQVKFEFGDIYTSTWYLGGKMDGMFVTVTNNSNEKICVTAFDVRYNGVPVEGFNNIAYLFVEPGESVGNQRLDLDYGYLELLGMEKLESISVRFRVVGQDSGQSFETSSYEIATDFECSKEPEFIPLSVMLVDEGNIRYELVGYRKYPDRVNLFFRYSNPCDIKLRDMDLTLYADGSQVDRLLYSELNPNTDNIVKMNVFLAELNDAREISVEGGLNDGGVNMKPAIRYKSVIQLDEEGRQIRAYTSTKVEDEVKWDTILASASRADK